MSRKYPQAQDGERITPVMKGYRMECCDCGLVHRIDFEVITEESRNGNRFTSGKPRNKKPLRVVLIPYRDNRATAQVRRHRK